MHSYRAPATAHKAVEVTVRELMDRLAAGEDPRRTIARLNARIIHCQCAGVDVPSSYLRLSRTLAAECVAQGHVRN